MHVGGIELCQQGARAAEGHGGCGKRASSPAPQPSPPDGKQPGVAWQPRAWQRDWGQALLKRALRWTPPIAARTHARLPRPGMGSSLCTAGPRVVTARCGMKVQPRWRGPAGLRPECPSVRCRTRVPGPRRPRFGGGAERGSPISALLQEPHEPALPGSDRTPQFLQNCLRYSLVSPRGTSFSPLPARHTIPQEGFSSKEQKSKSWKDLGV